MPGRGDAVGRYPVVVKGRPSCWSWFTSGARCAGIVGSCPFEPPSSHEVYELVGRVRDDNGPALTYSRKMAKERNDPSARALARESLPVMFTPHVPSVKGACPPRVMMGAACHALGTMRTLPRIAKDAARGDSAPLRVSDATYGSVKKYCTFSL